MKGIIELDKDFIRLARKVGCTFDVIALLGGVSPASVRSRIRRPKPRGLECMVLEADKAGETLKNTANRLQCHIGTIASTRARLLAKGLISYRYRGRKKP